jgi:DNA-binding NtrC family response regulator
MVMPHGVSGGALARVLQSRDPHLQTLYTSGYSSEVIREDLRLTHGVNFLRKPYDPSALLRAVRSCLERGAQSAGAFRAGQPEGTTPRRLAPAKGTAAAFS